MEMLTAFNTSAQKFTAAKSSNPHPSSRLMLFPARTAAKEHDTEYYYSSQIFADHAKATHQAKMCGEEVI